MGNGTKRPLNTLDFLSTFQLFLRSRRNLLKLTKEFPIRMPTIRLSPDEWNRHRSIDLIRREALERLYARKHAVDGLIRSLENYQRCAPPRKPECVAFSVAGTCS